MESISAHSSSIGLIGTVLVDVVVEPTWKRSSKSVSKPECARFDEKELSPGIERRKLELPTDQAVVGRSSSDTCFW